MSFLGKEGGGGLLGNLFGGILRTEELAIIVLILVIADGYNCVWGCG